MKRKKDVVWEAYDLDETFKIFYLNTFKQIAKAFHKNWNNINSFNKECCDYNVEFDYEKNDNIIIIKFKTTFMTEYKELFRFYENDKNLLLDIQSLKIRYNSSHILYKYYHDNYTLFSISDNDYDKDPGDIFDYKNYPEYLNGGYDYFTAYINNEIVDEIQIYDKNFNYLLNRQDCIYYNDNKITSLQNKILTYFKNIDNDYLAGYAFVNFFNTVMMESKSNVWFKWHDLDIRRIGPNKRETKSYDYYISKIEIKNDDNTIESIDFSNYLSDNGIDDNRYNYYIYKYYTELFHSIKNQNLKSEILNTYIDLKNNQSNYYKDHLPTYIFQVANNLLTTIIKNKFYISYKYIDIINNYLDQIINIDDLNDPLLYKIYAILKYINILYKNVSYAYSNILYDLIDKYINFINIISLDKKLYFFRKYLIESLSIFDNEYFNTKDIIESDHYSIDISIRYLYNLIEILEYTNDIKHKLIKRLTDEMKSFKSVMNQYNAKTTEFKRSIILNVLLSKNFNKYVDIKYLLINYCPDIIETYSIYYPHVIDYSYNDGDVRRDIHHDKSKYDIDLIMIINLMINKIIKDYNNKEIYEKCVKIANDIIFTKDFRLSYTNRRLALVGFFILNADKYDINIINKLIPIINKTNSVSYNAICSKNIVKIPSIIIEYLFPKIWSFKISESNLDDIMNILNDLQPEPGLQIIPQDIYKTVRDNLQNYIENNI